MKLVNVYTSNGQLEAEMVKTYLESYGIPAFLNQESAGTALGLILGPLGEVNIMVPEEYSEEASQILDRMGENDEEDGNIGSEIQD